MESILDYSGRSSVSLSIEVLKKGREAVESEKKRCNNGSKARVLGFEDGGGGWGIN